MLMSSAGFTGKTHLLSSERYDNIAEHARNVKDFFCCLKMHVEPKNSGPMRVSAPAISHVDAC